MQALSKSGLEVAARQLADAESTLRRRDDEVKVMPALCVRARACLQPLDPS
jgi:hypothetical protein